MPSSKPRCSLCGKIMRVVGTDEKCLLICYDCARSGGAKSEGEIGKRSFK